MFQAPTSTPAGEAHERDRDRLHLKGKRKAGADEDEDDAQSKKPRHGSPAPAIRLASVELLDGDAATVLLADAIQYVNLPREQRWVDGTVGNIDRLGRMLRIRVRFSAPGVHRFRMRLNANADNVGYLPEELAHPGFAADLEEHAYETGADGTLLLDPGFTLPAAGGNIFWISASDDAGTLLNTPHLLTRRLLYCQELVMAQTIVTPDLAETVATLAAQYLTLVVLPRQALPPLVDINVEDPARKEALLTAMRTAFTASAGADRAPFVFIAAYVATLAMKKRAWLSSKDVTVGPGQSELLVEVPKFPSGLGRYLWKGLDASGWWGPVRFISQDQTAHDVSAETTAVAVANDHHYPDQCRKFRVNVGEITAVSGKGTLKMVISTVEKLLGGVSFGNDTAYICLATRAGWSAIAPLKQQAIVLHEIGHKIGMVPDGTGALAKLATQYYGHGHVGSHCHHGLDADFDPLAAGACVMFGEALLGVRTFCAACAQAIRKADLGTGWPA